ncbi:MAG TPA: family 20 glycosylhydrolase, partial [Pyrinomonadaceae bacterium]|nr:family 20 glycosylhydrolase [Pyrinomonadaceae bacterium]
KPDIVEHRDGRFTLNRATKLIPRDATARQTAELLNTYLEDHLGFKLSVSSKPPRQNYIEIGPPTLAWQHMPKFRADTYGIVVRKEAIKLEGFEVGQFYALQTLKQLLSVGNKDSIEIPGVFIIDSPRFQYRGMHLDVARHFMPVEYVKRYVDLLSQYKFNQFHWHLTDDQGWRIEIKKYPRLTEIGSKRSESHEGVYSTVFKGDGRPVEGFYTQDQIRDVVAYAKTKHINVVPEIELPGHASAALAAYPELGCKKDYKYEVKKTWGIFKEVFCPTDTTFKFLEDVLDETIAMFPDSPYIHIGGDEVLKDFWKESEFVQELKKRENLKDEHEVQSYFVRRIEKHVNKRGKKIIGWDEILEGGIAPNATIMSWRGMKGGIEAAKASHDVIMTPTDFAYLDYGQGDPAYELLNIGGYLPLEKVYQFDPVPKELTAEQARYVIGGQANIWTEYIETGDKVEYMAFPRMLAIAESVWSKPEDKNFADFKRRVYAHMPLLDRQNVNYRIPEPEGLQNIVTDSERARINLTPAPGTKLYYSIDGSTPDERSALYTKPIEISLTDGQSATLKTIVVNGAGRKSVVYAATILRGTMRTAETLAETKPGVNYSLTVPIDGGEPQKTTGETRSIFLTQFEKQIDLKKPFRVQYDGYFKAPQDGVYELQVDSTWDATLLLGGKTVIDDAGTKDRKMKSVVVPLKAGFHKISLRYNHRGEAAHLRLRWGIKGQGLRQIGGGELVH